MLDFSLWLRLVTSGSFSPGKHKSPHPEIEPAELGFFSFLFFVFSCVIFDSSINICAQETLFLETDT